MESAGTAREERAIPYMQQLDALRAFAVLAVVGSHYEVTHRWFSWGGLGVELFFVLSGYLITGILLKSRSQVMEKRSTAIREAGRFYVRRFFRIFPVYYAALAVVAVVGIAPFRETLVWHLTYLSNFYFAQRGAWYGPISHLWSLAVEEQFYLVWPWLILFIPARWLGRVIAVAVLIGPASRALCLLLGVNDVAIRALPFTNLDLIGFGALLAWLKWRARPDDGRWRRWAFMLALPVAFLLTFVVGGWASTVAAQTARAVVFGAVVTAAAAGIGGPVGDLLTWRPLVYVGKVSYAIYLFHTFAAELTWKLAHYLLRIDLPQGPVASSAIGFVMTMLAAALSWRYFEGPLNRLKERFHAR